MLSRKKIVQESIHTVFLVAKFHTFCSFLKLILRSRLNECLTNGELCHFANLVLTSFGHSYFHPPERIVHMPTGDRNEEPTRVSGFGFEKYGPFVSASAWWSAYAVLYRFSSVITGKMCTAVRRCGFNFFASYSLRLSLPFFAEKFVSVYFAAQPLGFYF